jgi:tRNA pseudouridine38-40 synthase
MELSYHGADFAGWQIQPNERTVQGELIEKLSTLLHEEIEVVGAGRTDAGVHASKMIAHFDTTEELSNLDHIAFRLNRFLDNDVAIRRIFSVKSDAHARFSAVSRSYVYRISTVENPFAQGLAWAVTKDLNTNAMNRAASHLLGEKDFSAFARSGSDVNHHICNLTKAIWEKNGDELVFHISANRFLRNMVRAIVGTLVEVGLGKCTESQFIEVINSKDRKKAGTSAPSEGLYLSEVEYPREIYN